MNYRTVILTELISLINTNDANFYHNAKRRLILLPVEIKSPSWRKV